MHHGLQLKQWSTWQLLFDTGHNRLNVTVWRQKRKHFWQHLTWLRLLLLDTNANKNSFSVKQCAVSLTHTHHTSISSEIHYVGCC